MRQPACNPVRPHPHNPPPPTHYNRRSRRRSPRPVCPRTPDLSSHPATPAATGQPDASVGTKMVEVLTTTLDKHILMARLAPPTLKGSPAGARGGGGGGAEGSPGFRRYGSTDNALARVQPPPLALSAARALRANNTPAGTPPDDDAAVFDLAAALDEQILHMARLAPPALGAAGTRASAAGSWQKGAPKPLPQSVVLEAKKLYTEQQGGPPPTDREASRCYGPTCRRRRCQRQSSTRRGRCTPRASAARRPTTTSRSSCFGRRCPATRPSASSRRPSAKRARREAAPRRRRRVGAAVCASSGRGWQAAASVALAARRRGAHGAREAGARRPVAGGRAGRRHLPEQVWVAALCH